MTPRPRQEQLLGRASVGEDAPDPQRGLEALRGRQAAHPTTRELIAMDYRFWKEGT